MSPHDQTTTDDVPPPDTAIVRDPAPWPYRTGLPGRPGRPADPPVPRLLVGAAVAAGLACAAAIPTGRAGVGWAVAAAVVAIAVAVAGWRTPGRVRALHPWWVRAETLAWAAAAVALPVVAAVRSAQWLAALCLLTALAAGALAVAGRQMRSVLRAVLALPIAALRAVPWLGRAARGTGRAGAVAAGGFRLAASLLVGLVLVALFGSLLASADPVFAQLVDVALPTFDADVLAERVVLFVVGAGAVAGAVLLLAAPPALALPRLRPTPLRTRDWAVPVGALVALFALFVGVQFAALFGNDAYVLRTTGLTFAEYARSGFWQLVAVSVLALAVILAGSRWAPAATAGDRLAKRVLLGGLAGLCLVVVASAVRRMWLYQEAYGATVLRLLVAVCELWLGLCFVLVLVAVLRLRPHGTARPMLGTAVAALLALAVLDPERFVAEQNVARFEATGRLDGEYLSGLSADAVPALLRLPDSTERTCILGTIARREQAEPDEDWRSANVSRAAARAAAGHLAATRADADRWTVPEPDAPVPTDPGCWRY